MRKFSIASTKIRKTNIWVVLFPLPLDSSSEVPQDRKFLKFNELFPFQSRSEQTIREWVGFFQDIHF